MGNKKYISSLNKALSNKYVTINSYDALIDNIFDERTRTELRYIQEAHREHAHKIASRVLELGGTPSWVPGFRGVLSRGLLKIKTRNMSTEDILKQAYYDEDKNFSSFKKVFNNMDEDSSKITKKVLSDTQKNLQTLKDLMEEQEEQ